jgi:hypothetical protein
LRLETAGPEGLSLDAASPVAPPQDRYQRLQDVFGSGKARAAGCDYGEPQARPS